jgi:hypothetical protein
MRKMKITLPFLLLVFISCGKSAEKQAKMPLEGTWKLLQGILIEKGDTTITNYTQNTSFIKIINGSHFAFLHHDLSKGKDSVANYSSGGGKYTLQDSAYTEFLEYCTDRQWENNEFKFIIQIKKDTLIQQGIEKVESIGLNRLNIEKYVRIEK